MEKELKFNLPEIVVTGKTKPKRKPLYRNPYHFNPKKWVAARVTLPNIDVVNKLKYILKYIKETNLENPGTFIDLSNENLGRITSYTKDAKSILFNDFVEKNNNTFRPKKDFVNTTDTLLGDKKIPISKIRTWYGVENGKLKSGPIDIFNDDTVISPNRSKYVGRIKHISVPYKEYWPKSLPIIITQPANYKTMKSYAITESGDTIDLPELNATPKVSFANEIGNSAFVSNIYNKDNLDQLNIFLNKHPSYPIMVDNGRYVGYLVDDPNIKEYSGFANPNDMHIIGILK